MAFQRNGVYFCTTNSSNSNIKWHFRLEIMLSYRMKEKQTWQQLYCLVCQNCSHKVDFKILSNFSLTEASVILNVYQPNFIFREP